MAEKKTKKDTPPFFKNTWNIVLIVLIFGIVGYGLVDKDENGQTTVQRLFNGPAGGSLVQNVKDKIESVTEGCKKPPKEEVEAHFKDKAGSIPVAPDFDADPGEICGNGKKYFCTSKPPKKPIPASWEMPPKPGTDPNYQGPEPGEPFKESPYAMPSPKIVLARKPVVDLNDPTMPEAVKKAVALAAGKIGYVGNRDARKTFKDFGPHLISLDHKLFDSNDDEAVAKTLMKQGIDFVLVDRTSPLAGAWIENKMDTVRIRLRDAVSLAWFHPVVMGSGFSLFRVAAPFEIPKYTKRRLTTRVRDILNGDESPMAVDFNLPLDGVGDDEFRAVVSLRWRKEMGLKGRKLTKDMAHGKSIVDAIDKAAKSIRKNWAAIVKNTIKNRTISVSSVPEDIKEAIKSMEIEIDVLYDMCTLTDRTARNLVWYLELGLEGLSLRGDGKFRYLEPSYAVHFEVNSAVKFLERLFTKQRLNQFLRKPKRKHKNRPRVLFETAWRKDTKYTLGRFRTVNWIERKAGGDIVEIYRGMPLKTIWDVTRSALVHSLEIGADWLMENQTPDGQYAYKYTPTNKPGRRWTAGGNIVRHALNPYTLLMVNKIKPDPKYVESAKKGIDFTLNFLRHKGNRCVICHRDPPARYYNAKIGTVAVTILSILKLADVADISEYDDTLKCLAEELLFMQDPNGHFRQYDVPMDHPYYGAESTIAPGEFIFALSRLYSHYKDEKYKKAVDLALPWYLKAWRQLREERTPEGIYDEEHRVNLIGIVPWLVTAMNDLHLTTGDQKYADIAFEQQGWIDEEFFWYLNRAQYPDYVGASFKVHNELPAINSCQYTEGAAAAYDIAKRINKDVEPRRQIVVHGMRFCLQTQYDSYDNTFFLPIPKEAMGGYRYTIGHLKLRNDYSYHAMAAIAQSVEYLEWDDYPAERPLYIPPVLRELWGEVDPPEKDVPRTRPIDYIASSPHAIHKAEKEKKNASNVAASETNDKENTDGTEKTSNEAAE